MPFILGTLARRGMLTPGRPDRLARQLNTLRTWGYSLAGELRATAARYPRRVAVIDEWRSITYEKLVRRTDRVGRALQMSIGVGPGDRVGILCRNHGGMIELMIAVTALGADPVLVNTGLSGTQLAAVAEQQQLRLLCHDPEYASTASSVPAQVEL